MRVFLIDGPLKQIILSVPDNWNMVIGLRFRCEDKMVKLFGKYLYELTRKNVMNEWVAKYITHI